MFRKNAAQLYLGTTLTNENLIQEEIKGSMNSGSACYHFQNTLASRLLSKNIKDSNIQNYNFSCGSVWV
jgi:hypothetical protein